MKLKFIGYNYKGDRFTHMCPAMASAHYQLNNDILITSSSIIKQTLAWPPTSEFQVMPRLDTVVAQLSVVVVLSVFGFLSEVCLVKSGRTPKQN